MKAMQHSLNLNEFAPLFQKEEYTPEEQKFIAPFFTNLDKSVYVPLIFSPELIGALASRTSRAKGDLRSVFLREYVMPFLNPERTEKDTDEAWRKKTQYGKELRELIAFLHAHPSERLFANPRARAFYLRWLAEYGDDSIAQMAGTHLVFSGISQIAIKHFEDQRIGIAPIEKSTRYVNFSEKINGSYRYYTDPTLKHLGLETEYRAAMDNCFETYTKLIPRLMEWLSRRFPNEKPAVVEKKAFDTLRGILPTSTLSQVAFFGNGQAFEYLIARSAKHPLGEIRWAAEQAYHELNRVIPAFLRRLKDPEKLEDIQRYQTYLAEKQIRMERFFSGASAKGRKTTPGKAQTQSDATVRLIEYDPEGQEKIITGMLFNARGCRDSWETLLRRVKQMTEREKDVIISEYLRGRTARWQKVGRAFENAYVRWEIEMNIGAWRDLHRHRMLTQERQNFTCGNGYDVPGELEESGLAAPFRRAVEQTENIFQKIENRDVNLAEYAVTLAHRVRFMQWENLRQSFWQIELRTIPEGHPDYRRVEQEKFKQLQKIYPLIARHIRANMGNYDFARRNQEERIQRKIKKLANT